MNFLEKKNLLSILVILFLVEINYTQESDINVNEFSDFARMPKPTLKRNNLVKLLNENIKLLSEINKSIKINLNKKDEEILLECDKEQISRVFINLIKNSIESIEQKVEKNPDFKKKILIDISSNNDHILISIEDNGVGFDKNNIEEILNPYYTTKKNGTGLGLSIVNKIINDHKGELEFIPINDGAKIQIRFYFNVECIRRETLHATNYIWKID